MNTSIMNATAAMTMAEATEKVGFITKAKSFVKEHKTGIIIGTTAVAGVSSGVLIGKGAAKFKEEGGFSGLKDRLKSRRNNDNSEEQSA